MTDSPETQLIETLWRNRNTPMHRDDVMTLLDYPSPKVEPICAYALFQNHVIRANRTLAKKGFQIKREAGEFYRIGALS